ncbi:hypothetical protein FLAT13_03686 [Flavobacterium salmonis]|uniref:Uncharacterized protein n=1 Tax=Flavobacterium salmonis TaxID=2654844 RepID=A0A6V6Z5Y5_9FLAO|nr:hypothetical protein FLAT13_03686 [Flavobacterium salmonis]
MTLYKINQSLLEKAGLYLIIQPYCIHKNNVTTTSYFRHKVTYGFRDL